MSGPPEPAASASSLRSSAVRATGRPGGSLGYGTITARGGGEGAGHESASRSHVAMRFVSFPIPPHVSSVARLSFRSREQLPFSPRMCLSRHGGRVRTSMPWTQRTP